MEAAHWEALAYFHGMLDKHRDLVARRLLREETIPAAEKIFSLFEPHSPERQRRNGLRKANTVRTWSWVTGC